MIEHPTLTSGRRNTLPRSRTDSPGHQLLCKRPNNSQYDFSLHNNGALLDTAPAMPAPAFGSLTRHQPSQDTPLAIIFWSHKHDRESFFTTRQRLALLACRLRCHHIRIAEHADNLVAVSQCAYHEQVRKCEISNFSLLFLLNGNTLILSLI